MKGRIPANSGSLKKHFPKVYQELFSKCPIVVSAPGSFWWTGEHFVLHGSFGINQKIPLRAYVGIEPVSPKNILIGTLKEFSPEKKQYVDYMQDETTVEKLLSLLFGIFPQTLRGIAIHVITEIPLSRGLNSSGAFSTALAAAIEMYLKQISPEEIHSWTNETTKTLIKNSSLKFDDTFRKAWKIECIFHGDIASGGTILGSILSGGYPIVYFPPNLFENLKNKDLLWQKKYNFIDNLDYFGARLNELFTLPPLPIWPIDFALIYSGDSRSTASAVMSAYHRRQELANVEKEIKKIAKNYNPLGFNSILPKNHFLDIFIDHVKTISDEILLGIKELLHEGSSEEVLEKFFTLLKRNHDLLNFMIPSSQTVNIITRELEKYKIGYKITGGGRKGDIVVASPYYGIREQLGFFLKRTSKITGKIATLDYASWLDGSEDEGVKVEQNLDAKVYSQFVSEGAVQVKTIPSEELILSELYTKEKFTKNKSKMAMLLDCLEEEIYIKGSEISSKEIPTSKTTIKVLKILFENVGKEIKNTAFGNSSYFEDRNEFQSKIITPLNKTLQRRLGKKLNITVTGGITDFTVKLSPSPFDIYFLERQF